jgi:drug/metabolite transporter (DMT)-like permease
MKAGANSRAGDIGVLGIAALSSGITWIAIVLYCLSFVSWVRVLQCLPLGIAFALISVVHVLIPIGCSLFLHEVVSPQRWLGILLVLAGLMLMVGPVAKLEEKLETKA